MILKNTRLPEHKSLKNQITICICVLILGVFLGIFQKYLDISQTELPVLLMKIDRLFDLHNFLGGFSPWVLIAVCISIYSCSPIRAGANVFSFFIGMVSSYYLYSYYIGGFFPKNYAMIWIAFTIISPILAYFCWYSKGKGKFAILISSIILSFLLNTTFAYGLWYVDIRSSLNILMLLIGIIILRKGQKETLIEIILSIPFAIIMKIIIPFAIWG